MTLTETRPEPAPTVAATAVTESWPASADHKKLGLTYMVVSMLLLVVGAVLGELVRIRLSTEASTLLGNSFFRTSEMHATLTALLFLGPLWLGISTYIVPLQIGASRLALPRLHSFALWLYVTGSAIVVAGYCVNSPGGLNFTAALPPASRPGGANDAVILIITGLIVVSLGTLFASIDLAVTILKLRTEGLTFLRLPMFTTATFATAVVAMLSTPVFIAGLLLLYLDQRTGGHLFSRGTGAGQYIWQHTLWLFGRPDIYLLTLPGLGAACDIVATHARKPLLSRLGARTAICLFALLSLGAWAAASGVQDAVILPTYTIATALIALPIAILALIWLGTAATSTRPRFHVSVLFVLGFLGLLVLGAANAVVVAFKHLTPGDGAWTVAHVHVVAFGAPTLLAFAALYHWAPKILGRHLSAFAGGLVFLLLFGGFAIVGLGSYLVGYNHGPADASRYVDTGLLTASRIAATGGVLVLLGVVVFLADAVRSSSGSGRSAGADPYEGQTLEWASASPPPPHNFDSVPEVRSAQPLVDLRAVPTDGGAR